MTKGKDIAQPSAHQSIGFSELVRSINTIDKHLSEQVARAVNVSLTLRNWLIGFRIQEYEQHGNDRAAYGERLLELLAKELKAANVSRSDVRELRRYRLFYQLYPQIRDALSPELIQLLSPSIRDPYVFEFLGLRPQEVMSESNLEHELLDKLQEFLMELGNGFCFEARQQRILIGDTYYCVDLVFYHRLLKCHVLIDLKLEEFTHENIGQLNTYVAWYDKKVRAADDNPPIGILLRTAHDQTLVEYAQAGMSSELFVSKYQLQLPDAEVLQQQIAKERERLEMKMEYLPHKEEK